MHAGMKSWWEQPETSALLFNASVFSPCLSHTHHLASWKEVVSTGEIFLYLSFALCLFPRERESRAALRLSVFVYTPHTGRNGTHTRTGTFIYYFKPRRLWAWTMAPIVFPEMSVFTSDSIRLHAYRFELHGTWKWSVRLINQWFTA